MAAALDAGAAIINDVSGLTHDPAALALIARRDCAVVLMHMRGTPATMKSCATYGDVAGEVLAELGARLAAAVAAGIAPARIALDPGFGFAKEGRQNLALMRRLALFANFGCPLLIGVSRKRLVGMASGEVEAARRAPGSIAAGLYALGHGAFIIRVHDVAETVQAVRVWDSLSDNEKTS
jgi:dihydropteroate synthase